MVNVISPHMDDRIIPGHVYF